MKKNTRGRKKHAILKRVATIALVCVFMFTALPALAFESEGPEADESYGQVESQEDGFQLEKVEEESTAEPQASPTLEIIEVPDTVQQDGGNLPDGLNTDGNPLVQGAANASIASEVHSFTWQDDNASLTGVTLADNSLTYDIISDTYTTEKNALNSSDKTVTAELKFSVTASSEKPVPAGGIEIRLPQFIAADDDGTPVGTFDGSWLAHENDENKLGYSYHYRVDDATNEIVITNHTQVADSNTFKMPIAYTIPAHEVPHGYYSGELYASFTVAVDGVKEEYTSKDEPLQLYVNHDFEIKSLTKATVNTYFSWQTSWGAKPVDADNYYYAAWNIQARFGASRYSTVKLKDIVDGGAVAGEFVGASAAYMGASSSLANMPAIATWDENELVYTAWPNMSYFTIYVLTRYEKDQVPSDTTVTNEVEIYLEETGSLGRTSETKDAAGTATYIYNSHYPGDTYTLTKERTTISAIGGEYAGSLAAPHRGRPDRLLRGDDLVFGYTISSSVWMKNITNNGAKETTVEIVDNQVRFGTGSYTWMDKGDYEITYLRLTTFAEYDGQQGEISYNDVLDTDYASYRDITVEYQTEVDGAWLEAGTVERTPTGEYLYTNTITNETSTTDFPMPEGATGIRLLHTSNRHRVSITAQVGITLHASDTVKGILEQALGRPYISIYNYTTLKYQEDMDYVSSKLASFGLDWANQTSSIYSRNIDTTTNIQDGHIVVSNHAYMYQDINHGGNRELAELFEDFEQTEGAFYILLPKGAALDPASVKAYTYGYGTSYAGTTVSHTMEQVENWQGSGQTMLIVNMDTEGRDNVINTSYEARSGFTVLYSYYYTFESADLYGTVLNHDVGYRSATGTLQYGQEAARASLYQPEYFEALNREGVKDDTDKNTIYARHQQALTIRNPMEIGFFKRVKATDNYQYSAGDEVAAGNTYSYQLGMKTEDDTTVRGVVIYDVLENGGTWRGELVGLDVTHPASKGVDVGVYYSTVAGIDPTTPNQADLTNSSVWSETPPADLATVTALAFDLSTGTDGNEFVFQPNESVAVYIKLRAPENYADYADTDLAENQAYLTMTTQLTGSQPETKTEKSATTKMSLRAPDVLVEKTGNPASGSETAPTVVMPGEQLTYTISVTNTNTAEAMEDITLEDILPAGLTLAAEVEYYFGNAAAQPIAGAARVGVTASGQKLTFTVDKLAAGERISFVIPTTATGTAYSKLQNTAMVTKFNRKSWNLESETTYHEIGKITATKSLLSINGKTSIDETTKAGLGDILTYEITYNAPEGTTEVVITDYLPEGVELLSASPDTAAIFTVSGNIAIWTMPIEKAGTIGSVLITIKVVEIPNTGISLVNRAVVSYESADEKDEDAKIEIPYRDPAAKTLVDVNGSAKVDGATKVGVGDVLTYDITYSVPESATAIKITDSLPEGVEVISTDPASNSGTSQKLQWEIPVNSGLDTGKVTITVRVNEIPDDVTSLVNQAIVEYVMSDPEVVIPSEELEAENPYEKPDPNPTAPVVSKTVDKSPVEVGEKATFTITVTNPNDVALENVAVFDLLPAGLTCVEAETDGVYDKTTHRVTWEIPTLAPKGEVSFTVTVTAEEAGTYKNIAMATAPGTDGGGENPDKPDPEDPNTDDREIVVDPKPDPDPTTTSKPSTSKPSTSKPGEDKSSSSSSGSSTPSSTPTTSQDNGGGTDPGPDPATSRPATSQPVVVVPTTSRPSSSGSSGSSSGSSSDSPSSSGSSSSRGSEASTSSTPDSSQLGGGDASTPEGGDPNPSTSRGGLFSAGGNLGDDPTVQELIDETGSVDLFGTPLPLGSFALRGGWSLISLLLSVLSLLSAVVMFVRLLRNKKQEEEEPKYGEDGQPIVQYSEDGEEEEEEQRYKTRRFRMLLATLSGLLPILLFLILENLRTPMVLLTRWTPLIFLVTLIHFALVIIQMLRRKVEEEEEEQDEDIATV